MVYLDINLDFCRVFMCFFFVCLFCLCFKWSFWWKLVILKFVGFGFFKLFKNDFDVVIFLIYKIMIFFWINKFSYIIFLIVFIVKKKYVCFGCFNKDNYLFFFKVNIIFLLNIILVVFIYYFFSFCVFLYGLNIERDNC